MSKTVDERVVEMRFDNRQFESNVQTSLGTIDKLNKSLNLTGAAKGLENVNTAAKSINLSGLSGAAETVQAKFSALEVMAVTALANITNTAVNAGKRIASALTIDPIKTGFQEYETQINAVQTILANTSHAGTTIDDVNKALDELNLYADKTIYNFTEMTRNIGTFTAAGLGLEESTTAIKGIANLAAVSGSTSAQASTAMYQLSQALANGVVNLQDWNSVVNAGMGGKVFQDALIRTAAAMKGVSEETFRAQNITGSFRESIGSKDGTAWLTSDILSKTLQQFAGDLSDAELAAMGFSETQITEIQKMAQTANDAATKVKTFTQLWDTLKESAQSGWAQSWEIIVGDFEEAKTLLTEVSDTLGGLIGASADARNEMLQGWKDLGGRAALIDAVRNAFEGVMSIITPVKEAFREIFPPMTAEQLYGITVAIKNLTEKFKLSEDQSKNLKRTFKGLFAILDIVKQGLTAIWNVISPLLGGMGGLVDIVLENTASWGDWVVNLDETIKKTDIFNVVLQKIVDVIKDVVAKVKEFLIPVINNVKEFVSAVSEGISDFVDSAQEKFKAPGFELIHSLLGRINTRMEDVGENTSKMKSGVIAAAEFMGNALANSKILPVLLAIWEGVKTIASGIAEAVGGAMESLVEKIGNADFNTILDVINSLFTGGIAVAIATFLHSVSKPLQGLQDILDGVTGILDGVRGCFEAYQTKLKAGALLKIAFAIAILAASIVALSFIDSAKLGISIAAITGLFGDLVGSMAILDKTTGSIKNTAKVCGAMITMSIAVAILAGAMKKLSELDWEGVGKGLTGVAGLCTILIAASKVMSMGSGKIAKGAGSLVIFALAIKILASVCKDLATLGWEELGKGLLGVAGLMAIVDGFLNTTKNTKMTIKTAVGIVILSSAIKILASACKDFAAMGWEEIGKGLLGVAAVLGSLTAFINLNKNAKGMISTGIGLVLIGAAMKIFASAVSDFSSLGWEELGRGLLGMAGALGAVTLALNFMPKNMISTGIGLVLIGAAMNILAAALSSFGDTSWEELGRGLLGMAGALVAITGALNLMPKNLISSGVGLVVIGAAMNILASAMSKFGGMSWDEISRGLVSMGGALIILSGALYLMKGSIAGSAALLIASAALAVLAPVMATLGAMSWEGIAKSLVALAGAFVILGVAGYVLGPVVPAILGLAGALALIGVGIAATGVGLMAIGAGISAVATGLLALATIGTAGATSIVAALTIIISGVAAMIPVVLMKIGEGLVALAKVIINAAPIISRAILVVIKAMITALVGTASEVAKGIVELLTCVLETIADHAERIVNSVLDILLAIVQGIADHTQDFVEAGADIIIGFLEGISEKLPDIIQAAWDVVISFINGMADGIKNNNQDLIDAVDNLMDAVIEAVKAWYDHFKEKAKEIISKMAEGFEEKKDAAKEKMSELIQNAKDAIEEKWEDFKQAAKDLVDNFIQGVGDKIQDAKDAVEEFAQGVIDAVKEFLGIHSPSTEFEDIGKNTIQGFINGMGEKLESAKNKAKEIVSSARAAISEKWEDFKMAGQTLISNVATGFGDKLQTVKDKASEIATTAKTTISDKWSEFKLAGQNLISNVATGFGDKLQTTKSKASEIASTAKTAIDEKASQFKTTGQTLISNVVTGFGDKLKSAKDKASEIALTAKNTIGEKWYSFKETGKTLISNLVSGFGAKIDSVKSKAREVASNAIKAISEKYTTFKSTGQTVISNFVTGMGNKIESAKSKACEIANAAKNAINDKYESFKSVGKNLISGLISGIGEKAQSLVEKAEGVIDDAVQAAKNLLGINSPSKVFAEMGRYVDEGFIIGIQKFAGKVADSTRNVGQRAVNGMSDVIARVSDIFDGDMDFNPTIRPVLDLSDIQAGSSQIGGMFGQQTVALAGTMGVNVNTLSDIMDQMQKVNSSGTTDVVSAIASLRKDVADLADSFSKMKVVMDSGAMVGELVDKIDNSMGRIAIHKGRGN